MPRGALFLCLMTTACAAGGATGGAPIAYGPSGYARPAQPPPHAEYSDATPSAPPAYAPPQTPSPAAPQQQPEETALSAYALQPDYGDPRHPPRTHTVGRNESLYDIAVHYQIPMQSLIAQNGLQPPYALAPGRVIELPPPRIHVVAEGETFEDVARIESIDRRSLALLNRMSEPYVVHPGDQLVLPALPGAWSDSGAPPPQTLQPTPAYIPPPPTPPRSTPNGRFTWPVRGVLAASFGPQGDGRRQVWRFGASCGSAAHRAVSGAARNAQVPNCACGAIMINHPQLEPARSPDLISRKRPSSL